MVTKRILCPTHLRRVPRQFGWVDTRLVSAGYVKRCDSVALALYLLLVVVGDPQGLSYYSDRAITELLSIEGGALQAARKSLLAAHLIAYQPPLYQVLALEESQAAAPRATTAPSSLGRILSMALKPSTPRAGQHD